MKDNKLRRKSARDGRSNDLTFSWMLTSLGPEWEHWQQLAAEWLKEQTTGLSSKLVALSGFFESYLMECAPYATDVKLFFKGCNGHVCSTEEFETIIKKTASSSGAVHNKINKTYEFIDFVINRHLSEEDDECSGQLILVTDL